MILLINVILLFIDGTSGTSIAKMNELKEEAAEAYQAGNYEKSALKYSYIVDSLNILDEKAIMNLANSYYKTQDTENALNNYQRLHDAADEKLRSQAFQQMGVLSNDPQTLEKALAYFKESIKSDPLNDDARYNYEMLKKKLKEQQKQNQDQQDQDKEDQDQNQDQEQQENKDSQNQDQQQQNQDQQNQDQQNKQDQDQQEQENQEQQNQEGQEQQQQENQEGEQQEQQGEEGKEQEQEQQQPQDGEQKEDEQEQEQAPQKSTAEKLEEMNISEEKAKMILEALKNSEIQYIQQNRRKPTKRKDSNKPDW